MAARMGSLTGMASCVHLRRGGTLAGQPLLSRSPNLSDRLTTAHSLRQLRTFRACNTVLELIRS